MKSLPARTSDSHKIKSSDNTCENRKVLFFYPKTEREVSMTHSKPFILKLTKKNKTLCTQCSRQSCLLLNTGYCPALSSGTLEGRLSVHSYSEHRILYQNPHPHPEGMWTKQHQQKGDEPNVKGKSKYPCALVRGRTG